MKTNQIILALVGVALGFTATTMYLRHKNNSKKPCGCGCGGTKSTEETKMSNATGKFQQSSSVGDCRVCEGDHGIGYFAINGKCRFGDKCRS